LFYYQLLEQTGLQYSLIKFSPSKNKILKIALFHKSFKNETLFLTLFQNTQNSSTLKIYYFILSKSNQTNTNGYLQREETTKENCTKSEFGSACREERRPVICTRRKCE
jgi:hypothetical protein